MKWDIRNILARPGVYRAFKRIVGSDVGRAEFAQSYISARPEERILDIGCGTAEILEHLPPVDYVGFDSSPEYIASARQRFGDRGTFYEMRVARADLDEHQSFDIVLALGVVHHLPDEEAEQLFALARSALKPGGRLVTFDGCYVDGQSPIARFIISRDRGQHVRAAPRYREIASRSFDSIEMHVRHDMLRIPYTHLIMQCLA